MRRITLLLAFMMSLLVSAAIAQTTITGTVTGSADGSPIPGATVSVKGLTGVGTITDLDGKYSLKVPAGGETLVVSFVGMTSKSIAIAGMKEINVQLDADNVGLDEVVVVGYGVQKKREVTGSITTVKGDAMASLASPSFESQLAGRSAGVQVTTTTGVLGDIPRIRIRGSNSINSGTYPLIVVDGVPIFTGDMGGYAPNNALNDINPSDIESCEILKDGSATAIYGSRAANGVMLITTKKGSSGRLKVTYNNYVGVAKAVNLFELLDATQFVAITNEKKANAGITTALAAGTDVNTDWQAAVLRERAFQQDHSLSMSGSNDQTNYYFSLGYTSQEGVSKPNEMSRYTFRANLDQKVKKWLTIGTNASISRSEVLGMNTGASSLSGNIFSAMRQLPNTSVYDATDLTGYNIDNTTLTVVGRGQNGQTIDDNLPNIVYTLDNNKQTSKNFHTIANAYAQLNLLPYLTFKMQAGVDNNNTVGLLYRNPFHGDGQSTNGLIENRADNSLRFTLTNMLTFNKTFAAVHNVGAVVFNEIQKQSIDYFAGGGTNLSNIFFSKNLISGSVGTQSSGGGKVEKGFIAYGGRFNYNFDGKYFIQASVRRDGISDLPVSTRYGVFPGVSAGWTISKESFMSNISFISDFKIRGSYAEVGNVDIGNSPYLGLYGNSKYADYNGIAYAQMGNDKLQWETSKKTDFGFDASFLDSKYKLSFDYYINNIDNMIMAVPVPMSLGIPLNSFKKNIGSMKNWGYEFSAEATVLKTSDLSVSIDANLTLAGSKLLTLVNHTDIVLPYSVTGTGAYTILREGETRAAIYGYDYQGVNKANGNPIYRKADGTLVQGNIAASSSYKTYDPANPTDIATAATLSASDRKILGNTIPTYFGSVGVKAQYKAFDFNMMFRYSGGNMVMNRTRMDLMNMKFQNNGTEILGRWQSTTNPGDGWTPKLWYAGDGFINKTDESSSRWVEKGDFIKLQTLTIGYTVPKSILAIVGIRSLRIFAQGQDFFMITKYTGIDPEMEAGGVDYNGTPRQSVFTFGVSLSL